MIHYVWMCRLNILRVHRNGKKDGTTHVTRKNTCSKSSHQMTSLTNSLNRHNHSHIKMCYMKVPVATLQGESYIIHMGCPEIVA